MRILRTFAPAVVVMLIAAGCGGGGGDKQSPEEKAARDTVVAWGHADTPAKACPLMHEGFKRAVFRDPARCEAEFVDKLGAPEDETIKVDKVTLTGGQAIVRAERPGDVAATYYLMHASPTETTWKIAGIDRPPPPGP